MADAIMKDNRKLIYLLIIILAVAVNFSGINLKFFTDDPGLYASIAKNLIYKHSFFQLYTYNRDWLDKPHFPFWIVFFSFKIFGISQWAYRLPALLFFLLGLLYTWLFVRKYYDAEVAFVAVIIAATPLNAVMGNIDVRAEPYLMALIIGSIYHISFLREGFSLRHLALAALLTACAVMTKGVFVMVAIYGALFGQLLFEGRWKDMFSWKWLWLVLLTLIFILPEIYALYIQFDLHPEKIVFGRQGVSGIRWFLWDSQFGRFVNSGPINRIKASGSIFFFVHTLLWAFAPWCLLFYYAVVERTKSLFRKEKLPEYYALSGGLLLLILFSLSGFQLPFYTNAVFPLFAVLTAPFCIAALNSFGTKYRRIAQWLYVVLLPVAVLLINFWLRPDNEAVFAMEAGAFLIAVIIIILNTTDKTQRLFFLSCTAILFAGIYISTILYPAMIPYRGEISAAEYVNKPPMRNSKIYTLTSENNIFQFYCDRPVDMIALQQMADMNPDSHALFFVSEKSLNALKQNHTGFSIVQSFTNYPRENILPAFINKNTRSTTLDTVFLISRK